MNGFVSCLLSMLSDSMGSVPVAAVRSAVEAAWRPLCVHADAVALSDLVEVVARVDRSVSRDGDDMFEEGEKEVDETGSGSDDGESSEEDEGSDEEEKTEVVSPGKANKKAGTEAPGSAAQGKKRGREIQGKGTGGEKSGEAEEDEESDDGLDDAAMFRIDKYLAQTFSTLKSGRQVCVFLSGHLALFYLTSCRVS